MSRMKHYAEQVSIDMGLGGELTDEVLAEADRRLKQREWAMALQEKARELLGGSTESLDEWCKRHFEEPER
jgi:hypothetical protein